MARTNSDMEEYIRRVKLRQQNETLNGRTYPNDWKNAGTSGKSGTSGNAGTSGNDFSGGKMIYSGTTENFISEPEPVVKKPRRVQQNIDPIISENEKLKTSWKFWKK